MTRPVKGVFIIIFSMIAAAFLVSQADMVWAQQSSPKGENVQYTGDHRRNVRIAVEKDTVIVTGTIYSVKGSTIYMDGESFSLSGARIHDQLGLDVEVKDLYPGLEARLVLKRGSVINVVINNYFRGKVVTDPQELDKMRQRATERQGR